MTSRVIEHVDLTPTLTVPAGETLHVRILPWHDFGEQKDSKYIGLRNVSIEGMAFEPGPGPEGVEQTFFESSNPQIRKFIKDGILLIEKNGKLYTAQGVEVE